MSLTIQADAHARRVTLNLAGRSHGTPTEIKPIVSRLIAADWDWSILTKTDHETLYAFMDDDATTAIINEWDVDTSTIRDWGHPYDRAGGLHPWCVPADKREVDCELCGHRHNRWEFRAVNSHNGAVCWMGSTCVEKYKFTVDGAATAEASLAALKGALKRAQRAQTRHEWQAAHPHHALTMSELRTALDEAGRRMSYKTGSTHGIHVKAFMQECKGFKSRARATLTYYDNHGYLTPQRTDELPNVLAVGRRIVSVWKRVDSGAPAPAVGDVQRWWDAWIAEHDAVLTDYERTLAQRKRKWKDAWADLRDYERAALTDAEERLKRLSAPTPTPTPTPRRGRPKPPPVVNVNAEAQAGARGFAERLKARRAAQRGEIVSTDPTPEDFSDCPWN